MGLQLRRLLGLQLAIALCSALVAWVVGGATSVLSAVLGAAVAGSGAIAYVLVHGALVLRGAGERSATALSAVVVAELSRIGVTIGFLALVLPIIDAEHTMYFLATFIACLMAYTLLLLF